MRWLIQCSCMRSACFARWWRWQQRQLAAQRARIFADLGAATPAAAAAEEAGCEPDAAGRFPVLCPVCRLRVPAGTFAGALPWLEQSLNKPSVPNGQPSCGEGWRAGAAGGALGQAAQGGVEGAGQGRAEGAAETPADAHRGRSGEEEWGLTGEDRSVRLAAADLARLRLAQRRNAEHFCRQQAAVCACPLWSCCQAAFSVLVRTVLLHRALLVYHGRG